MIYWVGGQARVVARLGTHILGDPRATNPPCNAPTTQGSSRRIAMVPLSVDGALKSGFDIYEFEYNHPDMHNNTVVQGEAVLSGGCPAVYDGRHCSEFGFHYYPYLTSDVTPLGGGSLTLLGTYQWVFVYEWIDSAGVRHRSAPSVPVEYTLTGTDRQVIMDVATLQLTEHQDPENDTWPVRIVVYRTFANGSVFYEMPVANQMVNDFDYMAITFVDANSDSVLAGQPVLYTSGSPPVLPNMQPPAAKHIVQHNRRLWLISRDDPTLIWISKIVQPGSDLAADMPGWPTEFILRHEEGGGFTALASWASNLVAFKRDGVYLVAGEPGDDTNQGANLAEPQTISLYAGCVNPRSVVHTPAGLLFQSRDTFWLLDRGFQVKKVGMPVEDLLATYDRCTSAVVDPSNRVVLVTMVNGTGVFNENPTAGITLAWHYDSGEWTYWHFPIRVSESVLPSMYAPAMGACMATRDVSSVRYHQLQSDGTVFYLDQSKDYENSTPVLKVSTPWLQFNGITGFQRVSRVQTRSTQTGDNNMLVRFSYNHEEEPFASTRSLNFEGYGYVTFNGGTEVAVVGNVEELRLSADDEFSISYWYNSSDVTLIYHGVISKIAGYDQGWSIYHDLTLGANAYPVFDLVGSWAGSNHLGAYVAEALNDGNWHHIVWTYSGGGAVADVKCYIDGAAAVVGTASDNLTLPITNTASVVLGAVDDAGTDSIIGSLSNISVFGSELTATQAAALYASGIGGDVSKVATPIAQWRTRGDSYPTLAELINKNDATMTGMAESDLTTVGDYVTMVNPAETDFEAGDLFTVAAWVRQDYARGEMRVVGKRDEGSPITGWSLDLDETGLRFGMYSSDSGSCVVYAAGAITDTRWHLVTAVVSGVTSSEVTLYVDGVELTKTVTSNTLGTSMSNSADFVIGSTDTGTFHFYGKIDDVYVFDYALSASQVARLNSIWQSGTGRPSDVSSLGPVLWAYMGDGDAYPYVADYGSGGNRGTMVGMGPESIVLDVPSGPNCVLYRSDDIVASSLYEQHYETHVPAGYQKSKAMRVIIETQDRANATPNPRVENLIFTAGGKKGRFKLPDDNRG